MTFTAAWHGRDDEVVARRAEVRAQLRAAARGGRHADRAVAAGTVAGLIHGVEPAGDIVRRIVAEAERSCGSGRPAAALRHLRHRTRAESAGGACSDRYSRIRGLIVDLVVGARRVEQAKGLGIALLRCQVHLLQ